LISGLTKGPDGKIFGHPYSSMTQRGIFCLNDGTQLYYTDEKIAKLRSGDTADLDIEEIAKAAGFIKRENDPVEAIVLDPKASVIIENLNQLYRLYNLGSKGMEVFEATYAEGIRSRRNVKLLKSNIDLLIQAKSVDELVGDVPEPQELGPDNYGAISSIYGGLDRMPKEIQDIILSKVTSINLTRLLREQLKKPYRFPKIAPENKHLEEAIEAKFQIIDPESLSSNSPEV